MEGREGEKRGGEEGGGRKDQEEEGLEEAEVGEGRRGTRGGQISQNKTVGDSTCRTYG